MTPSTELRFAVVTDRPTLSAWQARCLDALGAVEGVALDAVVLLDRSGETDDRPRPGAGTRARFDPPGERNDAWGLYRRIFDARPSPALRPVAVEERLDAVPRLRWESDGGEPGPGAVEALRERDLAFILDFGGTSWRGPVVGAATYGLWFFRHGDPERNPPGPPGFWEICRGDVATSVALERRVPGSGASEVLHRGRFRTVDDSWAQNRDAALLGAAGWPARVCREILVGARTPDTPGPAGGGDRTAPRPGAGAVLRFAWKHARNYVANLLAELFRHERWSIGVVPHPPRAFLDERRALRTRWLPLVSSRCYRADPFGVRVDDELRILAEEFDYDDELGRLVSVGATLDAHLVLPRGSEVDGADGENEALEGLPDVLRGDGPGEVELPPTGGMPAAADGRVHVSYPYLLRHEGEIYCIPETAQAGAVRLYRARRFPDQWDVVATLVEFPGIDPTVFRHEGRWWLFCTDLEECNTRLHAWHADRLEGPWTPHALNPLKSDIRTARPAGTPFRYHGALFRPGQDCAPTYGAGIALNRILELTPTRFREVTDAWLRPDPDGPFPDGLHTLAGVGDRTLVDGKCDVFLGHVFRQRMTMRLRSVLGRFTGDGAAEETEPEPEAEPTPVEAGEVSAPRRRGSTPPNRSGSSPGDSEAPSEAGTS